MNRQHQGPNPVVGGASLLVIFAVLCLTVFALLGLGTAQAGQRLSEASAQSVADYYAADCSAEVIFARLRAGEMPEGVQLQDGVYSYSCPISQSQSLFVSLRQQDGQWQVLRWQAETTAQWTEDDRLSVWDGN